jgi:hypothetical protein
MTTWTQDEAVNGLALFPLPPTVVLAWDHDQGSTMGGHESLRSETVTSTWVGLCCRPQFPVPVDKISPLPSDAPHLQLMHVTKHGLGPGDILTMLGSTPIDVASNAPNVGNALAH